MDPQAAWEMFLSAIAERDHKQIVKISQDLGDWLRCGGFAPTVIPIPALSTDFQRALAESACQWGQSVSTSL